MLFILLLLSVAVIMLLVAESRLSKHASSSIAKKLSPTGKIIASSLFVVFFYYFGYQLTEPDNPFAIVILIALLFSWLGDVLLIPKSRSHYFLAGIIAFAFAHIGYAYAFFMLPYSSLIIISSASITIISALLIYWWLKPHLTQSYQLMVPAYLFIIAVMVAAGSSAGISSHNYWLLWGSIIFALSDIFVARNRFVNPGFINRLIGLPLYYIAQIMIAFGAINTINTQ